MNQQGPLLELLLRRLVETPQDFLDPPCTRQSGQLQVAALIFDLLQENGESCSRAELDPWVDAEAKTGNWLSLCAIACWLLSAACLRPWITKNGLLAFLNQTLGAMAQEYPASKYVLDDERREELARITLADLGLRPAGETLSQAQDRLQSLSSTERRRIIAAAREAEKRAREIREALIKKAAAESADKYTRE